jgi:integrase
MATGRKIREWPPGSGKKLRNMYVRDLKEGPTLHAVYSYQGQNYDYAITLPDGRRLLATMPRAIRLATEHIAIRLADLRSGGKYKNGVKVAAQTKSSLIEVLDLRQRLAEEDTTLHRETVRQTSNACKRLLLFFGADKDVRTMGVDDVPAYVRWRRAEFITKFQRPPAYESIRKEVGILRAALRAGSRRGWYPPVDLEVRIKGSDPKIESMRAKARPQEDVELLIMYLDEDSRDLLTFLLFTGLRRGEVERLTSSSTITGIDGVVEIAFRPKTSTPGKIDRVVLPPAAVDIFRRAASKVAAGEPVFPLAKMHAMKLGRIIARAQKKAGIPGHPITLRDMRATHARYAYQDSGMDIEATRQALRHSTHSLLMRYIGVRGEDLARNAAQSQKRWSNIGTKKGQEPGDDEVSA